MLLDDFEDSMGVENRAGHYCKDSIDDYAFFLVLQEMKKVDKTDSGTLIGRQNTELAVIARLLNLD